MTVASKIEHVVRDARASGSAEFALVLPVLLFFLFAIIDIGRLYYVVNENEKATQMGARYAIVTDTIPPKIADADYVGAVACADPANPGSYKTCKTGDYVTNPAALGTMTCLSTGCTCTTGTCPANTVMNVGAFDRLVARMHAFNPAIDAANVAISFRGSGLGYAGDTTGMDVIPLVTVQVNTAFRPITFLSLVSLNLPVARTTLSAESSAGTQSN